MLAAFQAWVAETADAMCDPGAPLAGARTVSADSVVEGQAEAAVSGYSLLEAPTLDDAVDLVRGHPFLTRDGSLQVSESVSVAA